MHAGAMLTAEGTAAMAANDATDADAAAQPPAAPAAAPPTTPANAPEPSVMRQMLAELRRQGEEQRRANARVEALEEELTRLRSVAEQQEGAASAAAAAAAARPGDQAMGGAVAGTVGNAQAVVGETRQGGRDHDWWEDRNQWHDQGWWDGGWHDHSQRQDSSF